MSPGFFVGEKKAMTSHHDDIGDAEFIWQFENQTLDPKYFDHVGHLRLACLYLDDRPLDEAIEATCSGIKAYAESLGASMKFHRTITEALVRIIQERRIDRATPENWRRFVEGNADIVEDCTAVLMTFYSEERLFGDEARTSYLQADLRVLVIL